MLPSTKKTTILAVILACIVPTIGALFYIVIVPGTILGTTLYIATKAFMIAWPLLATAVIHRWAPCETLKPHRHRKAILQAIPIGLATAIVMLIAYKYTTLGEIITYNAENIRQKAAQLHIASHFLIFGLFLAIAHSFLEEYYWRWYVFARLNTLVQRNLAIIIGSAAFAGHHYIILASILPIGPTIILGTAVGIGGAIWAWLFSKTHSIAGVWLAHLMADAVIVYVASQMIYV